MRVCAMSPVDVGDGNEHIIIDLDASQGEGRYLPRDFKNNHAATVLTTAIAAVEQQYKKTTSASDSGLL